MYAPKIKFTRIIPATATQFGVPFLPPASTLSLLLHFDGTNGSTSFIDSSPVRHFVNVSGDAHIDTSQSVFGGSSLRVTAAGLGYTSITDNDGTLAVGTGDFTIDFRVRFSDVTGAQHLVSVSENSPFFVILKNGLNNINVVGDIDGTILFGGTTVIGIDTWYHIAVTRLAGNWRLFIDGKQDGISEIHFPDANYGGEDFRIGDGGFNSNAWFDEFRMLKGAAAWVSDFTPPTSPYLPP